MKSESTKYVLISVRPEFAERIYAGRKTIEIRKRFPEIASGSVVVIYESGANRALSGWFTAGELTWHPPRELWEKHSQETGLQEGEFWNYCGEAGEVASLQIDKPVKFESPVQLDRLRELEPNFMPPQSFRYLRSLPSKLRHLIWSLLGMKTTAQLRFSH